MKQVQPLPISGYRIEKIYSNNQRLCVKEADGKIDGEINVGWDWRNLDADLFEVSLVVSVEPTPSREEFLEATVIGRFRQAIPEATVARDQFVRLQAPAIILPYVREVLSSLSSRGYYGTYYLPSLNVVRVMAQFEGSQATGESELLTPPPRARLSASTSAKKAQRKKKVVKK